MILLVGILTILSTLIGGLFAIRFKDRLHLILGFSAGAVIGVALFDLIPESISLGTTGYNLSLITGLIALGFVVYLVVDRFFSLHQHDSACEKPNHHGTLAASSLIFHSFLDGITIGLAFKVNSTIGWVVAIAVLTHDFSDGINTVNMILRQSDNRRRVFWWLAADALAPFLGIVATFFFTISAPTLGLILAIFAGLFLYLGASDLIPESHHRHPSFGTTVMTILGITVLYLATHLAS